MEGLKRCKKGIVRCDVHERICHKKMPLFAYLRPPQPGRSSCNVILKLNFHKSYFVNCRILTSCGPVYNVCFFLR